MILTTILLIRKSLFLSLIICVNACLCYKRKKQALYCPNIQMLSFSLEHTQTEDQTLLVSCHTNVWLNEAKRVYLDCHFFLFHLSPACRADKPTSFLITRTKRCFYHLYVKIKQDITLLESPKHELHPCLILQLI